jgi:DNA-binding MurR/RpiR family transcriptional regulator
MDRVELTNLNGPDAERTGRVIYQEINNLNHLYKHMDMDGFNRAADLLVRAPRVMTVGSRLSYSFSYLLGWMLTRVRPGVDLLKGSDTTALDRINEAPPETLVVVVATSRYSNELIRAARHTRRLGLNLLIVSDSPLCPLNQFGHVSLIAPCRHIPVIGSPSTLACLINCLLMEVIARGGSMVGEHQARLERHYRENDLLFNLEAPPLASEESVRPDNGEGYGT